MFKEWTMERLHKQVLNWILHGKIKSGRPRKSWRKVIDRDTRERGLEEYLWEDSDLESEDVPSLLFNGLFFPTISTIIPSFGLPSFSFI